MSLAKETWECHLSIQRVTDYTITISERLFHKLSKSLNLSREFFAMSSTRQKPFKFLTYQSLEQLCFGFTQFFFPRCVLTRHVQLRVFLKTSEQTLWGQTEVLFRLFSAFSTTISQVTFIYIALLTIQLYRDNKCNKVCFQKKICFLSSA